MDDEVEDLVGDVKYANSQKSVTTSGAYSLDFTDSSPERNNSSGKETYVIEYDDSDDSEKTFQIHRNESVINLNGTAMSSTLVKPYVKSHQCSELSKIVHETFTQTSKTIIELAQNEIIVVHKPTERRTLNTQTSILSITENKTMEYITNVRIMDTNCSRNTDENNKEDMNNTPTQNTPNDQIVTAENISPNFPESDLEDKTSGENIILFIDDESKECDYPTDTPYESTSEFESTKYESDIEYDSLMENEYHGYNMNKGDNASDTSELQKSVENDVEDLYNKISEIPFLLCPVPPTETCVRKFGILTPLPEEPLLRKENFLDLTPGAQTLMESTKVTHSGSLCVNNGGVKIKMLSENNESIKKNDKFKLPLIHQNNCCTNKPRLNFLFSLNSSSEPLAKSGPSPCAHGKHNEDMPDRWEISAKELASGESPLISGRSDPIKCSKDSSHLPPIHVEGAICHGVNKLTSFVTSNRSRSPIEVPRDAISIQARIRELKMMNNGKTRTRVGSRNCSPASVSSCEESRSCDAAERACDNLCIELLRRLRALSWLEITETLEHVPKTFQKYWSVMSANRIIDLLRQVIVHIESPRTQLARAACTALAEILKNTNYTRKPDFYEGISILLAKTGSYSRPLRRAANVALDEVVSSVDVTHSVTAVCVYGVGHKSALVRCAAARLLVVCCALAEAGRQILRARPATAATARRHVLRALAELLNDKNIDTRKYAERLYRILRPLPDFEAYFLTDVDVELAARHMKKYDQMLLNCKQAS